jgi:hypothetical protein
MNEWFRVEYNNGQGRFWQWARDVRVEDNSSKREYYPRLWLVAGTICPPPGVGVAITEKRTR